MDSVGAIAICCAYILGLLATAIPWGGWSLPVLGVLAAIGLPGWWRGSPNRKVWLLAGVVGLLASLHLQLRAPQPTPTDISLIVQSAPARPCMVNVKGRLDSQPRLTRSQKAQFWLRVERVEQVQCASPIAANQPVGGKLYVTVPLLQATGLAPEQSVNVLGTLYRPSSAANPGAFDFREYLQQEGSFAGLRAQQVTVNVSSPGWNWSIAQQWIVRSQIRWLGSPEGPLVSAMVLGSKAVDLPFDVKDAFVQVGLAAALAASGFQTSLILGVILALTRRWPARLQFGIGTAALLIFVGLTGLQPSIVRAAIMGFGSLVALLGNRKVKPLGALLVTAVLMLLVNPQWIWDLGFQLSFLATMGLLVTVPPLTQRLDWLPGAIVPLVSVPIAAYIWTLPLQLAAFGVVSPYTIPVNILTTPFISLISLGGMLSALAAVIWSPAGSALAWLLKYPTQGLLAIVNFVTHFPGSAYAVGTIPALLAIGLYGLLGLTWLQPWWQRRWWFALLLGISMVLVPAWQAKSASFQTTVLATTGEPVLVIQDGMRTGLINSGTAATAHFTVLPFLQQQGVNRLNWAIAADPQTQSQSGWSEIQQRLPINTLYYHPTLTPTARSSQTVLPQPTLRQLRLPVSEIAHTGSSAIKLGSELAPIVEFKLHDTRWLWLGPLTPDRQLALARSHTIAPVQVLWWSGQPLRPELLAALQPAIAIASSKNLALTTIAQFRQSQTQLYWTGRDGAIQWTPKTGFKTTLESEDNQPTRL